MSDELTNRRSVLKGVTASVAAGLGATTAAAARSDDGTVDYADPVVAREALSGHEDLLAELAADDLLESESVGRLAEEAETIESGTASVDGVGETPAVQLTLSVDDGEVDVNLLPERDVAFAIHRGVDESTAYGAEASGDCPKSNCWWVCTWIEGCFCHCLSL